MYQWCVYQNPADYPNLFVARKWLIKLPPEPTNELIVRTTLDEVRRMIIRRDPWMMCMGRQPGDDPVIVEVWL